MTGGGAGGKGAAAPVPSASRKLVQSLKEIVNRPEAEIYAVLRDCGMDPDEAVGRLLSQDTFQEVKSKRDKKKEIKEAPEPRSRLANNSTSRGIRGGADRGGRNNSLHSSSTDSASPRPPVLGPGTSSINSNQKQTVASSAVNKHMAADGPDVTPLQSSSGFQHGWSGTPGQLSMADIVKMGRPQGKPSSKPVVTADRGYAGQYPSLPSTVNQNLKQSASTVAPIELDKGLPPAQDSVQVKDQSHCVADNKQHTYGTDWSPHDEPTSANQSSLPETSGDPSLHETSLQSSNVINSHENSYLDENSSDAMRPAPTSERHLEHSEGISEHDDGILKNSSSYQSQKYSYTEGEVEDSSADVLAAAANFQSLSLHNEELVAKKSAEDNPAVIIPDHLQVTDTECVSLSFGSFGSGAFSGLLPPKAIEELPVQEESAPVDQIDARNQDFYEIDAVNSSANENLEAMMGTNVENVDAPPVSQANELRQEVLDPSGIQYDVPSVSSHAYSNTNTSQQSTIEDPQGNNQAHTLSHLSNLMQANPLSTSLLGSNQNHATLRGLEFDLPYLEAKYNAGSTTNPRPAISMQEALKTGVFTNTQSTQNLPSTSIPPVPPLPQQLAAHPYSQPTLPLTHFANMIGYPYVPQNYTTYLSSAAFQQAYPSNGPFHQSAAAVLGSGMKYSMPEYQNNLSAAGLQQQQTPPQQQPSSVISGYGGFGSSSNLPGNFTLNQSTGSASTLGFDEALSRQYKDTSQYMALHQGDNSAMWLHGSGSRAASALPPSHFYGYQGQSQQGGFRQTQQPQPSQFGGHGYPTFYQSQGGLTQEHPQNLAEGSLNGYQTAPSQPSHPSWQHQHTY